MKCFLCNYEYSEDGHPNRISGHITNKHPEISIQEYYDRYLKKENEGICQRDGCNNKTTFQSIKKGYCKYCCVTCGSLASREQMAETCISKYGYKNVFSDPTCREKNYQVKREKKISRILEKEKILKGSIVPGNKKQCQLCGKEFESTDGCSKHVSRFHKMKISDYYDRFFKMSETEGYCPVCNSNEKTTFISLEKGYYIHHPGCPTIGPDNKVLTAAKKILRLKLLKNVKASAIRKEVTLVDLSKIEDIEEKNAQQTVIDLICNKCSKIYSTRVTNLCSGHERYGRCPSCFPKFTNPSSKAEGEIYEFISSFYKGTIIRGSYGVISNLETGNSFELDVYLPDLNIAIEYDGLYWHSEKEKGKNYHLNKTKLCEEKGIRLIHIFEDEWMHKEEIVKSRLMHLLGYSPNKYYARDCQIREISANEKNIFLEENHIQGGDCSDIKLGAFYKDLLVSVMTFSKGSISKGGNPLDSGSWELVRFSVKQGYSIVGIASKLLTHFRRNYAWTRIYSFADLRWSEGDVYNKMGFSKDYQIPPSYWYVDCYNIQRFHRYNMRKRKDEPKDIPERVLREQEGYLRIWDCGILKFSMHNQN